MKTVTNTQEYEVKKLLVLPELTTVLVARGKKENILPFKAKALFPLEGKGEQQQTLLSRSVSSMLHAEVTSVPGPK